MAERWDAIVVGAGPNGLTAAVVLARAGLEVLLLEEQATIGGGARTAELTLPGFRHDVCSAIHPLAAVSPAFRFIGLERLGVRWDHAPTPLAHPFADGSAAALEVSLEDTAQALGRSDGAAWRDLLTPFLEGGDAFFADVLEPVRIPRHPLRMARFARHGLRSCAGLVRARFAGPSARALFAGCAAHSMLPLEAPGSAAFGLILALAGHAIGWPAAQGGSQAITEALARHLRELGGTIRTHTAVRALAELPPSRAVLFDLAPRQVVAIAGEALPARYRRQLTRFRHGPGVFKLDWALAGPIPWRAAACRRAATVHVGGSFEEIAAAEHAVAHGRVAERPFLIVAQQSLFDASRAPAGRHTGWAYCHVPHGSTHDLTAVIEARLEALAPGFRDLVLGRHALDCARLEAHDATMIGGDIGGGANDLRQLLFRPVARFDPYATPHPRLFLCSSSTPPGGGVHGMCGFLAARSALRRCFGRALA